jgi:hypothetical protein
MNFSTMAFAEEFKCIPEFSPMPLLLRFSPKPFAEAAQWISRYLKLPNKFVFLTLRVQR